MLEPSHIELAHRLADAAGSILRKAYRQPVTAHRKSDASPVTRADREVETAMRNLIQDQFPDHGIIGEEFGNVRGESPYQWVLDPIDGTRSFIGGYPLFTTLISLVYENMPILGIIDQPISGERWVGMGNACHFRTNGNLPYVRVDPGLRRNDVVKREDIKNSVLATTSIDYFTPAQSEIFKKLKAACANTVLGGDAYAYAMLASGHIDVVVDAGLKPYDFCALKPVIEGAGGVITDWRGAPVTLKSDGRIIAGATLTLHRAALALLSE